MPLPFQEAPLCPQIPKASCPLNIPFDKAYMSNGDILLTNERMEKSIPYISLYSWRERGRVRFRLLREKGLGWEGARIWRRGAGLGLCAFGDAPD
jgi:hypothetical protein